MKILFNNVLLDGTFSAGNASPNYPVDNLKHEFLHKRYQHLESVYDTVTITLDTAQDINYFFAGYTNASQLVVRLYSSVPALLSTDTLLSVGTGTKAINYGQTYSVKTIEIDVYGSTGTYLGGVGAGVVEDFGDPVSEWTEPWIDNTILSGSTTGQKLRNLVKPLRTYNWEFRELTRALANYFNTVYDDYGLGAIVWIAHFADVEDFINPMYAIVKKPPDTRKNGRRYDQIWSFEEAK